MSKSKEPNDIYAFPKVAQEDWVEMNNGMTLLDWFAGQALSAFRLKVTEYVEYDHYMNHAAEAYGYAYAMLKRREELGVGK